jgi:hypothetical protein
MPFRGATRAFHDSGQVNVSLLSLAMIPDWRLVIVGSR